MRAPLKAAIKQMRDVAGSLSLRSGRSSRPGSARASRVGAGGAHAAAGSPSPERCRAETPDVDGRALYEAAAGRAERHAIATESKGDGSNARRAASAGTPDDKYLRILKNLQAKGGAGTLAAQFLEPRDAVQKRGRRPFPVQRADSDSLSD